MGNGPPQRFVNPTNELAKERNRAASERTINAWTGICISLMGFGVAFDQISRSLRRQFPQVPPAMTHKTAPLIGLGFVGVGLVLLVFALVQRRLATYALERQDYVLLPVNRLNRLSVATLVLTGLIGLGVILLLP